MAWAAVTALSVPAFRVALSCSAMINTLMNKPSRVEFWGTVSDHLGFGLEFADQLIHIGNPHARRTRRGRRHAEHAQAGSGVHSQILWRQGVDRLLVRLHDIGPRRIAGLAQTQVGGHHRRQLQLDSLLTTLDLTRHLHLAVSDFHATRESAL